MLKLRKARPEDCETVVQHVHGLARDIGVAISPRITADALRSHGFGPGNLLTIWVAETENGIVGSCISNVMFSTWRGVPGIYVIDLYVTPGLRGARVGEKLLRAAARDAWANGARFIRLDVDRHNEGAARFYERAGFRPHDEDRFFVIDPAEMQDFIESE